MSTQISILEEKSGAKESFSPLVSVCIPTFQHALYIKECLESVLSQKTDFPFEVLIGEDCSTDGTREICQTFSEKYPEKIRLFLRREEDKILMFGRKAGRLNHLGLYKSAQGKYVCFCDGDDYWIDPHKLQKQVSIMEANEEISLCITQTQIQGNVISYPPGLPKSDRIFSSDELKNRFYLGHISSWMVRNRMSELLKNKIVSKPVPLDQVLFLFYRLKGRVYFLKDITSVYRFNPTGVYRSQSEKKNHKALYSYNWYLFRYLHKDPILYIRANIYNLKRGFNLYLVKKSR